MTSCLVFVVIDGTRDSRTRQLKVLDERDLNLQQLLTWPESRGPGALDTGWLR